MVSFATKLLQNLLTNFLMNLMAYALYIRLINFGLAHLKNNNSETYLTNFRHITCFSSLRK